MALQQCFASEGAIGTALATKRAIVAAIVIFCNGTIILGNVDILCWAWEKGLLLEVSKLWPRSVLPKFYGSLPVCIYLRKLLFGMLCPNHFCFAPWQHGGVNGI